MLMLMLPVFAGLLWAICYAFMEQSLNNVSLATWYFIVGIVTIVVSLFLLPRFTGEGIDFKPLFNKNILFILLVAVFSAKCADLAIAFALKSSPATFVAFGEISYVLFVPFVTWFIFKNNQITTHTLLGGLVVFAGVSILLLGQMGGEKGKSSDAPQMAKDDAVKVAELEHTAL